MYKYIRIQIISREIERKSVCAEYYGVKGIGILVRKD
jgi:hypothetical protein